MREMSDSNVYASENYATETDDSCSIMSEDFALESPPKPVVRAKSAKDLVKRQEDLITMLQKMKSDLAKMDREACQIKEDVVRSNQLVNVMVHMKQPHHLTRSVDGYNLSYSQPKVTYSFNRRQRNDSGNRHLHQLSTFLSSRPSSRSSSLTDRYSTRRSYNSDRGSSIHSGTDEQYSGTESECDEFDQSQRNTRYSNAPTAARYYAGSHNKVAGSSTESGRTSPEINSRNIEETRRQSFFFAQANRSEPQIPDEVDL